MYVSAEITIKHITLLDERKNNTLKPKCLFDTHIMEPLVLRFLIIFSIFSRNFKKK